MVANFFHHELLVLILITFFYVFFSVAMPYNNLTSLQSWFSSELDFLGIDSAIYSRHVLNLFLNADYMMDYRLAEKEASIFANLSGIRKR